MRRPITPLAAILAILLAPACRPAPDAAPRAPAVAAASRPDSVARHAATDSVPRSPGAKPQGAAFPFRPGEIPPDVRAACDSAAAMVREALALPVRREEGEFYDEWKRVARVGCRLAADGRFKALKSDASPVDLLQATFVRHGWRAAVDFSADGPDGSVVGVRRRDKLCVVRGSWDGGDDSDTTATPDPDPEYEAVVECDRDVVANTSRDVPDSLWNVARAAGLDSAYAFSLSFQWPPYLTGDFDGDGVVDAAVLVEHRATGAIGVAVVRRGAKQVTMVGGSAAVAGPSDLAWVNEWGVFHRGTTVDLTIGDRPGLPLVGDALWVGRRDSLSAFYVWTTKGFVFEAHRR